MMLKRDHVAILHDHKRTIRKLNDELARERAANHRHVPIEEAVTALQDESEDTVEDKDSTSQQSNWSTP
ncbi:hypothetical protein ACMU6081_11015 [Achromobacter mucicolens]|uniref:Uncharacterized protein n=2 Tax=Alcaligenaceae TaxID=506 RepID=A0ABM8LK56_9BURK|nr:hypothetical protein LMG3415_05051 [Achromobacter mucicolens]